MPSKREGLLKLQLAIEDAKHYIGEAKATGVSLTLLNAAYVALEEAEATIVEVRGKKR